MSDISVKIRGKLACFTRPEFGVERISYDVITPSAARNALQSIFWHYPLQWRIEKIDVLQWPPKTLSMSRNEVNQRASPSVPYIDVTDDKMRSQRNTFFLKNVAYVLHANAYLPPEHRASANSHLKYITQMNNRVTSGACWSQPFLGCRECVAFFNMPTPEDRPIDVSVNLGRMLFDIDFRDNGDRVPVFFEAKMEHGTIHLPQNLYDEMQGTGKVPGVRE